MTKCIPLLLFLAANEHALAFSPRRVPDSSSRTMTLTRCRRTSPLDMAKDNDRARLEKTWEDAMGEDWREFRARLVQQEHIEGEIDAMAKGRGKKDGEKIGNFITGAISSIFSKRDGKDNNDSAGAAKDIFDGEVGGASKYSKIPSTCSDPFMDEVECQLFEEREEIIQIDKHRWAHPLSHIEPGSLLVANEKLGGVFHQTVVLIIDHNESTGSTGMVINRPFPGDLIKIASETESNIDLSLKMAFSKAPVAYGGPVMQDQFSTLHGFGEVMGSKKICPGVFVGGSSQLMNEVRRTNLRPTEVLFVKGHAAWVPGQLSREIEKGVWYIAAASSDLILRYAGAPMKKGDKTSDLWADILLCMGDKFESIATSHAGRGDERMLP